MPGNPSTVANHTALVLSHLQGPPEGRELLVSSPHWNMCSVWSNPAVAPSAGKPVVQASFLASAWRAETLREQVHFKKKRTGLKGGFRGI